MRTLYFIGLAIMAWIVIRGIIRQYRISSGGNQSARHREPSNHDSAESNRNSSQIDYRDAKDARYRDVD